MSWVVGLRNNAYKPITNTVLVLARLCRLHKGCTQLASASDKVYQLLTHGRWFSPGTPASATTKAGYHDITEILLKMPLKHTHTKIKSGMPYCSRFFLSTHVQYPWVGFWLTDISFRVDLLFQVFSIYPCPTSMGWDLTNRHFTQGGLTVSGLGLLQYI